ncbi:complement decay-accelerating factor isoform X2 [Antechinus flavipes]|uniref:complement decay-accelerating factor isoform X2 n=1 Tax=Antechinus flavipes TaxID=38775 RepID=UPI00223640DE|nr:complement decay-accelerating factor isoform X2 [Antechinus flavipes]
MSPAFPSAPPTLGLLGLFSLLLLLYLPAAQGACSIPPEIPNAKPELNSLTSFPVNSTITYKCNEGFVKIPGKSDSVVCLQSNKWSKLSEFCNRTCNVPPSLRFASLKKQFSKQNYFPVGFTVQYECRPGYKRDNSLPAKLTCLQTSMWSNPSEFCKRKSCSTPPDLLHGQVSVTSDILLGSTITFTCNEGYRLVGAQDSQCILMDKNVVWSDPHPECTEILCHEPPKIAHGGIKETQDSYKYGSSVTYMCSEGFSLIGEKSIHCTIKDEQGEWSGPLPECKAEKSTTTNAPATDALATHVPPTGQVNATKAPATHALPTKKASATKAPVTDVPATPDPPTGQADSTKAPVTDAPATHAPPTGQAAATKAVVTDAPATHAPPTGQADATKAPATHAPPTGQADATKAPATHAPPTGQADATKAPATHTPPTGQADATKAPATHAPPTGQADATKAPATHAPPTGQADATNAPVTDAPATHAPPTGQADATKTAATDASGKPVPPTVQDDSTKAPATNTPVTDAPPTGQADATKAPATPAPPVDQAITTNAPATPTPPIEQTNITNGPAILIQPTEQANASNAPAMPISPKEQTNITNAPVTQTPVTQQARTTHATVKSTTSTTKRSTTTRSSTRIVTTHHSTTTASFHTTRPSSTKFHGKENAPSGGAINRSGIGVGLIVLAVLIILPVFIKLLCYSGKSGSYNIHEINKELNVFLPDKMESGKPTEVRTW